jgi:beta-xylosidase
MNIFNKVVFLFLFFISAGNVIAWEGMPTPQLHVDGRYLKDPHGNVVNLHGFAQTYSPWFNEKGKYWDNYNVAGCLSYNKGLIDKVLTAGFEANFIRMHMDPYWSNNPGQSTTGENDISAFNFTRFKKYLDEVFVPMAEYIISKGMYVIMRPPGVCPEKIAVGDAYNQYLIKVWGYVAQHPKLKNNPAVMFELANEPVNILGPDGTYGAGSQGHFDNLKTYFQAIVDTMRASADNILWVPGLGYQSLYQGYATNPIEGKNIGYAVHVYPGWFNSGDGYANFQKGWDDQVKPVADFAPIVVTEMDWAPEKYNSSWGKAVTGTAGGAGFGANFKKITDASGNVSWLIFTGLDLLAKYTNTPPAAGAAYTFLNDPEACPWPTYHWYQEYAKDNYPRPEFEYRSHSDNGDGTFTNPVIFSDFPDPDVIRVGDVYYMVTTTMHHFPGATILKSFDLVNWEYCANPLESIELTSCYNLDGCSRYSHGQWASSLKYKNGTFYLHFNTLDEGSYLLTATDPEGTWTKRKLSSSFYDAGLFFDDDGKTYIVSGINKLHIAELDSDFKVIKDQEITFGTIPPGIDNKGTEGSHLYKINGYYYIYATTGGYYATQVAFRSKNIFGPYDEKEVLNSDRIHQGALIQTQTGEWWTMLFIDKGAYGRLPSLHPVTWVDGWPMVGVNGKGVTTYKKPNVGKSYPITSLPTNDNFRNYRLGMQWGWNHNPYNTKWSLIERPGYLRIKTANVTDSLHLAKNTLTQRLIGFPNDLTHSYGTIAMEIKNMHEGDVAGLAVFQDPYAYIGVKMTNGQKKLVMYNNGIKQTGPTVADSIIYLRAVANFSTSKAEFYYSFDNSSYTKLGTDLSMKYDLSVFVGNRFCLFNYATIQTGGYVDFDWFTTDKDFTEDKFYDNSFVGYSAEALTLTDLVLNKTNLNLVTGSTTSLSVKAVYADGRSEDISIGATYTNNNPDVIRVVNGQIIALNDGEATITVSYQGVLGEPITKTINVISSTFPLVSGLLNPSIYSQGTFDEATHTLITGQYGFGGWWYNNGLDLSDYKYLIAQLGADNKSSISFRVFDENNYWSGAAEYNFGNKREVVVTLGNMFKSGTKTKLDPSHIYIVGFWSMGNSPIVLKNVFLSNSTEYDPPTGVDIIQNNTEVEPPEVDVYNIMGMKIRSHVKRELATKGLRNGVYLVGKKKVIITNKY